MGPYQGGDHKLLCSDQHLGRSQVSLYRRWYWSFQSVFVMVFRQ